ncbi:MAG: adenine phosphoribosyltransferase [Angustibacter sp.]
MSDEADGVRDHGDALSGLVADRVRDVPDFPQPGVVFKDITPLLADGPAFRRVIAGLVDRYAGQADGLGRIDVVAGIESRGFVLAAPLAVALGAGFVPVRKAGKLPGPTHRGDYQLEYGTAAIEVHQDAATSGQRVLVVDDVLATGGTARTAVELIERTGAQVVELAVLIELPFLGGRDQLVGRAVHSVLSV